MPEVELGEQQYSQVTPAMTNNPRLAEMVKRFEDEYDSNDDETPPPSVELSAEIEAFLDEVRGGDSEDGPTSGGI